MAIIRGAVIIAAVAWMGSARADQPAHHAPSPAALDHYKKGDAAYTVGDYKTAIVEFRSAYAIDPAPLLLWNIAQAYRLDGEPERALFLYKQYIAKDPNGRRRVDAEDKIRELEDLLKQQQVSKQAPPVGTADIQTPPTVEPGKAKEQIPISPSSSQAPSKNTLRMAGIGVAAGGVALAVIGIGLTASAPGIAGASQHAGSIADGRSQHDRAVAFNTAGWSLLGVGAAVAVVGAVMIALPKRSGRVHAWISPTGVGVRGVW